MEFLAKTEADRLTLRHLSQLYFHEDGAIRSVSFAEEENLVLVTVTNDEKSVTEKVFLDLSMHKSAHRAKNAALGKAFSRAARAFTDYAPPYGNLFGVRPVKVPLYYLENGWEEESGLKILENEFFTFPQKARLLTALAKKEAAFSKALDEKDGMLYVSIPFCPSRCNYCSFISASAPKHLAMIPEYLALLIEEIRKTGDLFREKGKRLRAVYVGGGTPGILNEKELELLLREIRASFSTEELWEFSVEMGRPDTVTEEKLRILKDMGARRISINPQTTNDDTLLRIGRHHDAKSYFDAMEKARAFDFFSVNCDLIAGLDKETPEDFLSSVSRVLSFSPENLTVHALCQKRAAEKKTQFQGKGDFYGAMELAHRACEEKGLFPYYLYRQKNAVADLENLGFAAQGEECLYNVAMMEDLCDVFAVGAGSITKLIPKKKGGKILRLAAYKYPYEYLFDPDKIDEKFEKLRNIL